MGTIRKEFLQARLADIIPYENNPRQNEEAVAVVIESIRQTGNLDPIEVDEGFVILSGHTRYKALRELGYTETEVVQYTGLTEEQKRKYRLLANKTGEVAKWDPELLAIELEQIDFGDFDFGFRLAEPIDLDDLGSGTEEDSEDGTGDPSARPETKMIMHCPKCGFVFEVEK